MSALRGLQIRWYSNYTNATRTPFLDLVKSVHAYFDPELTTCYMRSGRPGRDERGLTKLRFSIKQNFARFQLVKPSASLYEGSPDKTCLLRADKNNL